MSFDNNTTVVYRTIPTSNHNSNSLYRIFMMLYIVLFLHQTTTLQLATCLLVGCISYYSYIKPQLLEAHLDNLKVVYRTIPTSNHNYNYDSQTPLALYIVLFLHQTTTFLIISDMKYCCISYYSYIKPQLFLLLTVGVESCISYYSYIKPQLYCHSLLQLSVVYRTIPTSNHNLLLLLCGFHRVVYRTIPTSNHNLRLITLMSS